MRRLQIRKSETGSTYPSLTSKGFDKVTHFACSIANFVSFNPSFTTKKLPYLTRVSLIRIYFSSISSDYVWRTFHHNAIHRLPASIHMYLTTYIPREQTLLQHTSSRSIPYISGKKRITDTFHSLPCHKYDEGIFHHMFEALVTKATL